MDIRYFRSLPSTQTYLVDALKEGRENVPLAVRAEEQSSGVGSRDNCWSGGEGNFFASIAVALSVLPADLPLASASIYFSFIMKQTLGMMGEDVWLKWPNDFYLESEKVGGTITQKVGENLVCGIGINLKNAQHGYRSLESKISAEILCQNYLQALEKFPSWKQIFREYQVEFERSRDFSVHAGDTQKSLKNACLEEDGSLVIDGEKVFSLR